MPGGGGKLGPKGALTRVSLPEPRRAVASRWNAWLHFSALKARARLPPSQNSVQEAADLDCKWHRTMHARIGSGRFQLQAVDDHRPEYALRNLVQRMDTNRARALYNTAGVHAAAHA